SLGTGTLGTNGQAAVSTSDLSVATHTISVSYSGDTNFGASSNTLTQTVNQASTSMAMTSSDNPSVSGDLVTFTATVPVTAPGTGTPTGTVTFPDELPIYSLGTGTLDDSGQASVSTSNLAVEFHTISASYSGDTNFSASSTSLVQSVGQASTSTALASSDNP